MLIVFIIFIFLINLFYIDLNCFSARIILAIQLVTIFLCLDTIGDRLSLLEDEILILKKE